MAPLTAADSLPVGILFVNVFMMVVTTAVLGLRLWARSQKDQSWQVNDWTVIVAWVIFFGMEVTMNIAVVDGGLGQPITQITLPELMTSGKAFYSISCLSTLTVSFAKISVCDLFKKLFPNQTFHIFANILIGVISAYMVATEIVVLASCMPFAFQFDKTIPGGKCIDTSTFYTAVTAIGVALDFLVVILPLPVVWQLQMNLRKKLILTFLFSLALIICGISIGRATINANATLLMTNPSLWDALTVLLGTFEAGLSIIIACAPLLQPVATRVSSSLRSLLTRTRGGSTDPEKQSGNSGRPTLPFAGSQNAKLRRLQNHLFPDVSKGDTTFLVGTQASNLDETPTASRGGYSESVEMHKIADSYAKLEVREPATGTETARENYEAKPM